MSDDILKEELETYKKAVNEMAKKNSGAVPDAGKFMLIKGEKIIAIYETKAEALKAGAEEFGLEPFMVKQIYAPGMEPVANFTRSFVA